MRIWILDIRLTAERRMWMEGWARHSRHSIFAFTMPSSPRIPSGIPPSLSARGRTKQLTRRIRRYLTGAAVRDPSRKPAGLPDLILLTDGLDGAVFMDEVGDLLAGTPLWIYWHTSAIACAETSEAEEIVAELHTVRIARRCLFHGESQRQRFLSALNRYEPEMAPGVEKHAAVLPPGFEPFPPPSEIPSFREPLVLWILRGDPEEIPVLIATLDHPVLHPHSFQVLLLSERPEIETTRVRQLPPRLRARILGILNPETQETQRWASVARAAVDGSTRLHSPIHLMRLSFGGPWPLVPAGSGLLDALSKALRPRCTYDDPEDLAEQLAALLEGPAPDSREIRQALAKWIWPALASRYDDLCEAAQSRSP